MSTGNRLPQAQAPQTQRGQRALRLVAAAREAVPSSREPSANSSPSPTLQRLQRELEAARDEAHTLHELLEQLPAILERKFQLRLGALLAEQRQLEQDNALLQHHVLAHLGAPQRPKLELAAAPALPAARGKRVAGDPSLEQTLQRPITQGLGLRRALRHVHLSGS